MSAPPQAVTALAWALAGPPILIYGATRIRRGRIALHVTLMSVSAVIEIAVVVGFSFLMAPSPRRAALVALPFFKIHLAFAVAALAGLLWQLTSRAVARLRPRSDLRRHAHPPRQNRPACDPHECERGHRDRGRGRLLFPHGSQSPSCRPRRAAVLQDPSRLRRRGARRALVAADEPRRGAPAAAASAHRSVRPARMVPGAPHRDHHLHLPLRDGLSMKTFLRHLVVCSLPLLFAAGSGYYFTTIQGSCGAMVGALFSGKCAGRQRQDLARFQLGGGAGGVVIAGSPGAWAGPCLPP